MWWGTVRVVRSALTDANVVDGHLLWKHRGGVGVTWPATAHGVVDQEVEGMIEHPRVAGPDVCRGLGRIQLTVEVPADHIGFPLDGEHVKVVGELGRAGHGGARGWPLGAGEAWPVHCAVNDVGLLPQAFHDVYLATRGPVTARAAHHPERRPNALPEGDLDARLEMAIGP